MAYVKEKIKSTVRLDDFKRYRPKRLRKDGDISIEVNSPKRDLEIRRINRPHLKRRKKPLYIPLKPPLSLKERKITKPQANQLREVVAPVVTRPLQKIEIRKLPSIIEKQKFVSEARRKAIERGRGHNIKQKLAKIKQPESLRNSISQQIRRIESLRDLGTNRTLVIIAAGPSVLEVDFLDIANHPMIDFMCINKPYVPIWPSKFWAFCDHTQYKRNMDCWNSFDGIIINSPNVKVRKHNQIIIRSRPGQGFCKDVTKGYHIGRSSTYANLQVAFYMDYKRIYVLGVDMNPNSSVLHHYGQNPDVASENRKLRFPQEAKHYLWAGQHMIKEDRDKIYFCSSVNPWPFLKYFNKLDHKDAIEHIKDYVKK